MFANRLSRFSILLLGLMLGLARGGMLQGSAETTSGVGVNVAPLGTGGAIAFVDAMKEATPWSASGRLKLDAAGNVVALGAGQVASTVIYPAGPYRAGDYTLLYDGGGTFSVERGSGTIVARAPGRLVIAVTPKVGSGIRLHLLATGPHDYARNIRLIVPGFTMTYGVSPFDPAFVAGLRGLGAIRFAGWQRPDPAGGRSWAARTVPSSFTQAGPHGVAPEYAIALANAAGVDPWFTLPVDATDDYVSQFAQLVARNLDPRLRPAFELGHEVWLAGSAANGYAELAGRRLGLASDARVASLDWYGLRSEQMFALVDRAFAASSERPRHVLSGPLASAGTSGAATVNAILRYANAGAHADALAVSADATKSAGDPLGRGTLGSAFSATAALAGGAHVRLVAYRGGSAGEPDPGLLGVWHAAGGGLFVADALTAASPRAAQGELAAAAAYSRLTSGALADAAALARATPGRAVGVSLAADGVPGTTLLAESFAGAETPARSWLASGDTCLTAGTATTSVLSIRPCNGAAAHAAPGNGALQLTAAPNRRAFAVYRTPLETSAGLDITFTNYAFGGASLAPSAVTLFLADAAGLMPTAAAGTGAAPANSFLSIAIGQALAVRGPARAGSPTLGGSMAADGSAANLPFTMSSQARERPLRAPTVRAILAPNGVLTVALDRHDGQGFVAYYQRQVAGTTGSRLPASVFLGFTAATGSASGRRQIADVRVATLSPATTFAPTQLADLAGWYDATNAASLTKTAAGAVTAWNDRTSYGDTLSVPATHTPPTYVNGINGLGTVSFDGTQVMAGKNAAFSTKLFNESTVFIVGNETPTTESGDILFSGAYHTVSPTYAIRPTSFSDSYFAFNTETGALTAPKLESGATIWTTAGSVSNKTRFFRRNGGVLATGGAPALTATGSYPLAVGSMYSGGTAASYNYRGEVGEIVVYDRLLAPAEYTEVEGYLACKWGLQSRLAAGHPYRTVCPGGVTGPTPSPAPTSPPSGVALPDPVQLRSSNGTLTVSVTAVADPKTGNPALDYNGSETPPTLRLFPGDTLIVNLTNKLATPPAGSTYANDVNLHYHGLHVSPNYPADDSIDMVATPGKSVQYKIPIPTNHPPGLYWYHSHAHAESERQNLAGMSGAIVIEGITKYTPAVTNLPERIIIVRDRQPNGTALPPGDLSQLEAMRWGMQAVNAGHANAMSDMAMGMNQRDELRGATNDATRNPYVETNPFYQAFVRPDAADGHCQGAETANKVWTVNGVTQPSIGIKPGEKQFWRLVNAGSDTYLDVQIDRASMQIISLDGVPLITGTNTPASMTVSHYVVPPASRIEFIVTGPAAGTTAYVRTNCFDAGASGLAMPAAILASIDPTTDATAASRNVQRSSPRARPFAFHTAAYIKAHAASLKQTVYFSEQLQINGQSYNPSGPPMFYAQVGTTQDWTIVNTSTQVHTFHMHQIHFIVEAIDGVTQAQQFVMDNVNVPSATSSGPGTVEVRLDFTDPLIVGTFLVHCHILSHEDAGMMAKIRVGTAAPIIVNPASLTFASPTAAKQTVSIAGGKAPYSPSGCTGVAKASISGTTLSVTPAGSGGCLLTVEDATGLTASISVTINAVKSPISLSSSNVSFASTKATAQTVEIGGGTLPYAAGGCGGITTETVKGQVLTVTPAGVGTCTITVSDAKNNTASLSVTVNSPSTGGAATDDLTFHQDPLRTGWNQHESTLTTANVASNAFAKLTSLSAPAGSPAFGKVYAQPLYVTNEATSDGKTHNLVVIATSTDQVYAFDDKTYQVVWHRSFLGAGVTQQSWADTGCYSPGPDVGITGTPVIDRGLDRIYAVVATKENGTFHQRIHAISLRSGAEAVNGSGAEVGPTDVTGTVTMSTGGAASVDPLWNLQRPALLESAGNIYVALGSKCDWKDNFVHGWMLAYSASTLAMTGNLFDTSNSNDGSGTYLASIWSAYGPAADPQGNVYFSTGNGPNDNDVNSFGMSVVKVAGTLSRSSGNISFFTPYYESADSKADGDLGSGGIMLMPDQTGTYTHMIVAGGKCGSGAANGGTTGCLKYVLNRDKLGGRQANEAGALWHGNTAGWMWGGPAYFQDAAGTSHVIYGGGGMDGDWAPLSTYNLNKSPVSLSIQSSQSAVPCMICTRGNPGGSIPIVSSNATAAGTAIVWAIQSPGQSGGTMTLYAFNALNMSSKLFSGAAGNWSVPPGAAQVPGPFVSPMVANGKVYVPVDGAVGVFGLKGGDSAPERESQAAVASELGTNAAEATGHIIYGTIARIDGTRLTIALRNGRLANVDASVAIAAHTYAAPLYIGKLVTITGSYGADGTLQATTISKLGRADASAPPDR
jgi:suppressor of ftsI